jgi:hypothetical protein
MRRLLIFTTALAAALLLGPPGEASAGTITFTNTYSAATGTGNGTIDNVLVLHATGQGTPTSESGSVFWTGTQDDGTGDAEVGPSKSQTYTAAYLQSSTNINYTPGSPVTFNVIFQVNQQGALGSETVDLQQFAVDFFAPGGGAVPGLSSVEYTGPTLTLAGVGVGTSGWIFEVELTAAEADLFFGNPNNRLGMSVDPNTPINDWNDGAENFYIAASETVVTAPEPGTMALAGLGALSLLGYGLRRRMLAPRGA